jgi:hypothetical protein
MTFLEALRDYKYLIHPDTTYIVTKQSNDMYITNKKDITYFVNINYISVDALLDDRWLGFNDGLIDNVDTDLTFGKVAEIMNKLTHGKDFKSLLKDAPPTTSKKTIKRKKYAKRTGIAYNLGVSSQSVFKIK